MKILKSKKGFTMLELLMVVIVIGILASLAIPQYQSFMERARSTEATNIIGSIKSAEELYVLENPTAYGADADIDTVYIDYPDADDAQGALWTYAIVPESSADLGYEVTATRVDGPEKNATVIMTYEPGVAPVWSGTHTSQDGPPAA
jgi:prepilin-type N-terminal cleavage/methylation domain-containing protein